VALASDGGRRKSGCLPGQHECQPACKPGSVRRAGSCARDGHSSRPAVAGRLKQPTRATIRRRIQGFPCVAPIRFCSQWGLPCRPCCHARGALLPHHFTLTFCGGLFSVALSLGLPPPEVIRHRVSVEPGLSSALKAAAIRPAGLCDIVVRRAFVNCGAI
jgi:hypothetical protein